MIVLSDCEMNPEEWAGFPFIHKSIYPCW